jgi:Holliday junction resolvase RusA-like endonuclease
MARRPLATWPQAETAFEIEGPPIPLQRPRFSGGRVYNPSSGDLRKFRDRARPHCAFAEPPPGPLRVRLEFVFARPKAHLRRDGQLTPAAPRQHLATPDIDNLSKFVLDALNQVFYADDRQIVELVGTKRYGLPGEIATTRVVLMYGVDAVPHPVAAVADL